MKIGARGRAAVFCLLALAALPARAQSSVTLTILSTTDLHGHLEPWDYYADRSANLGLVKIATLVRRERAAAPHLLLLDCGDAIQGTPLAYFFARKQTAPPNPTVAAMNALHYDAMAVGNHEFNFGLPVLWKAKGEARFPWLAANLRQGYTTGAAHFRPYVIRTVDGIRVGIVGFVTPGVTRWEIPDHYRGYQFEPIVEAARRVIPEVRRQVDLLVVIAHSGLDRDPETGAPTSADQLDDENAVWELAEQVPGIDLIFFGHTHRELPEKIINGVLLSQAKYWGQSLARAEVTMERQAAGGWRVASKHAQTIPVTQDTADDPELLRLAEPYHRATQKYLNTPIARCPTPLDAATARVEDEPLVELIHKVQRSYGRADVSMATMFNPQAHIPAGRVTVRQIAALYIYENTLYTVEMTGGQLKEALEHAASFYPSWPPPPGPLHLPSYSADSASGVSYGVDLRRPVGDRIRELSFRGRPLEATAKLRVAINNYRYTGGGRYAVYRNLPILYRSPEEIRDLIIEYVTRRGQIPATTARHWEIVPPEAAAALLQAARAQAGSQTSR